MSGGKGGSNQTVAYYYAPVAFAICEGPIVGLKKIWAGGNLIFSDNEPVAVNTYQGGGKKSGPTVSTTYETFTSTTQNDTQTGSSSLGPWTCYLGTETQPADPTIGEGVAYRGVAYIVFNPLNIGPGATIPPLTFEVVTIGTLNPPSLVWSIPITFNVPADLGGGTWSATSGVAIDDSGDVVVAGHGHNLPWVKLNAADGTPVQFGLSALATTGFMLGTTGATKFGIFYLPSYQGTQDIAGAWTGSGYYLCAYDSYSQTITPISIDGEVNTFYYAMVSDGQYLYSLYGATLSIRELSDPYALKDSFTVPTPTNGYQSAGAINSFWFAVSVLGLLILDINTGTQTAILENAVGCDTDGVNIGVSYINSAGVSMFALVDTTGTVLSQFSIVAAGIVCFQNGFWWIASSNNWYKYNSSGVLIYTFPYYNGQVKQLLYVNGYLWGSSPAIISKIDPGGNTIIAGTMDLPAAVTTLCERAGITQFDVSLLPPIAVNFVRGDTVTARSMLTRLSQAYFFSMVDSGGVLRFVPQGQASQAVIPLEDLGYDKVSANAQTPYTGSRISGVDLPRSVKIRYISAALNWEKYEQIFALESYESGKEITLDLPLILDDQTAYNIAALACTLPHAERMQYSFTTSYKWLALEPGDVVTLPFGTCRILTVKMGQKNGIPVIDFTCCIDGMNAQAGAGNATPALPAYAPNTGGLTALLAAPTNLATVHTPSSPTPHPIATAPQMVQTVPNAGVPKMVLVEPPPLKSTDTGMRFMTGAYSTGNVFPGAAIFQSTDGGNTYSQLTTEISATDAGYANTVLPAPNAEQGFYTWDTFSTVDIYMLGNGGDLIPLTDLQVMNGGNGAMLGQELIQYAQATLMTDSLGNPFYRLSRLLRGRRGTEWAMGTHQGGEPFYAIPSALSKESYTPPMLNNAYLYKVVMMGGDLGNAPAISYEPNGNSLRQWAVCHPAVSLDASNNWTVSWVPRARYNGDWASGYIPTLDSDTAGWSIDVLSGTTVKRTIQVPLTQTAPWQSIYTAAMQSADGFTPGQSGIIFNLYQLSSQVGRGTVRSITTP